MGSRPLDERTLVVRAKRGDTTAYEELVRRYQGIAFRVALVAAGDAGDAEEAVQDGFVKAFRALARFRDDAPFRPWVLRIVTNEARNRRRSAGRRAGVVPCPTSGEISSSTGSASSTSATARCSSTASSSSSARRRRPRRSACGKGP